MSVNQLKDHKVWGENYVSLNPFYFGALRLKYCLSALKNINGKVIEIGCGAGAFVRGVKKYRNDLELLGSDIDIKSIELAQQIDKVNKYVAADVHKLPFRNEQFNAVIGFDIIEHVKNPQKTIDELNRVTLPNGVLHISIPLEASLFTIHGLSRKLGYIPKLVYADHTQQYNKKDVIKFLKQAGYSDISFVYSGHLIQQLTDFTYFSLLYIFKNKPAHTVEGYIDNMEKNIFNFFMKALRSSLSFLFFSESILLKKMPGMIGHFTAYKK